MKESSVAEKIIAAALIVIVGMVYNLNREVGIANAMFRNHVENHPNVALESDVGDLQRRLREHQIGHPLKP